MTVSEDKNPCACTYVLLCRAEQVSCYCYSRQPSVAALMPDSCLFIQDQVARTLSQ